MKAPGLKLEPLKLKVTPPLWALTGATPAGYTLRGRYFVSGERVAIPEVSP